MATSAFKSTSRRGASAAENKAPPPAPASRRRSHSVSAVSRKTHVPLGDKTLIPTDFSNSRDNPLFWTTSSPPPDGEKSGKISESGSSNNKQSYSLNSRNASSRNSVNEQRGRSVTRSFSEKNGIGRSLSRVRGRSVSRAPCKGAYESEKEQDTVTTAIAQHRNAIRKIDNGVQRANSAGNRVDMQSHTVMRIQNQATEWSEDDSACSMQISNLEDGISIGSLSEAEEKTASDELNAFQRNNANRFTATSVADTPSDFVNPEPEAVELISEIRREYAIKLEESEERTRKLRADLAIEEHRGKELDRILKEILPDPNTSVVRRSRRGRRTSNERKRMSKYLTEDAMAYFDECVSLSTFDSSDFSASEDPPYSTSAGVNVPVGTSSLVKGSPSTLCSYDQGSNDLHQIQIYGGGLYGYEDSSMTCNSGSTQLYHFSITDKKVVGLGAEEDITFRCCIKNFEKGTTNKEDIDLEAMPPPSSYDSYSYYDDVGEYSIQESNVESLLIDRVLYNSRIESGGLLLCTNSSFLPFMF